MAYAYIDTSALAKWYLPEAGSDTFATWIQQQTDTCISSLTRTEFRCLLARRQRMGLLTGIQVQELYAIFQQDCQDGHLLHFPVTNQHIINAELMLESLPTVALRTLDALHLSIAHDISAKTLATADQVMAHAAQLIGIEVVWFGSPKEPPRTEKSGVNSPEHPSSARKNGDKKPCVKYIDLELAMSFVSSATMIDVAAYISRKTGKIYWESSDIDEEDKIPDDINDSSLYASVPHQSDLDLGKRLVLRFTAQALPDRYDQVSAIFRRQGAYSRFKELLDDNGMLQEWYKYENSASETALREWATDEGFTVE